MGRFCILCEQVRPNEAFGGKGGRAHICRQCRRLPRDQQHALSHEREILRFLRQSHISDKNRKRLSALAGSANPHISALAALVLDVAAAAPYRRPRIGTLARQRRDLLNRMEDAGLIPPRTDWDNSDPNDIDPVAPWYEWAEYAGRYTWDCLTVGERSHESSSTGR